MRVRHVLALLLLFTPLVQAESVRVLHVMSYHRSWEWNREQFEAFKTELADLSVEYKVVELDGKRVSKEELQRRADEANRIISEWKPHLVYANDDIAQEVVTKKHINHPIPFVYSAVNKSPQDYGFDKATNITGVLEHEHFLPTIRLLKQIQPKVKKIGVITDADPTWHGVLARMREDLADIPDIEVVEWLQPKSFGEYKKKVGEFQKKVDALALLGIFQFMGSSGSYVDYQEVLRWTAENSRLPDFSFWDTRIDRGTLCAVTVSGIEQGREAGRIARKILVEKTPPASIAAKPTTKGRPAVSLARAKDLDITVPSSVLLSSKVAKTYIWDQ